MFLLSTSGGSKQKWVPLNFETTKHSSSKGGGGGGPHRDRHREGGIDHSHGRYERGRWRSERERYHPPPRYSNHPPAEYTEGYGVPPAESGYGYQGGRGVGGRGGGRGRNWRYLPPGGQGSYKRMSHLHTYTYTHLHIHTPTHTSCAYTFITRTASGPVAYPSYPPPMGYYNSPIAGGSNMFFSPYSGPMFYNTPILPVDENTLQDYIKKQM